MITEDPRVLAIRAEYLAGSRQRAHVTHAIARLLAECDDLCSNDVQALDVLFNLPEPDFFGAYVLQVESTLSGPGAEIYPFETEQERRRCMMDHMAQAVEFDGEIEFRYYYSKVDPTLEKYSMAYFQMLPTRELVGAVDHERQVYFEGQTLGTIAQIAESGQTVHTLLGQTTD